MTRRRWLLLAGLLLVGWIIAAGFLLLRAAGDLQEGRDLAEVARADLDPASLADGGAIDDLGVAADKFRSARRTTGHPLLAPMRVLPVVGRQLRAVRTLAAAAEDVAEVAATAATDAVEVLGRPPTAGPARVAQVRDLTALVERVATELDGVDLGSGEALVGPLARARADLADELTEARQSVDDAAAGARAALTLLEGPRRYLLVAANNAEMRAGSGMWLSGGVLTTADGNLRLDDVRPLYEVADPPDGAVPIADRDLRDRWGAIWNPSNDWRALMVSPRLPASAALAMDMWEAAGEEPVDGVLVVDPISLAALVRGTNATDPGGNPLNADEIPEVLLHRQYLTFDAEDDERREALGFVARLAFGALDAGGWDPAELAAELAEVVRGRHLLAWSRNPVEQEGWVAAGMAGDLGADSLALSVLNRGANKLDYFLDTEAELTTERDGDGTAVTVRARFANEAPSGLPRYIGGPPGLPGLDWAAGTYVGLVTLNVPGAASDLEVDGDPETFGAGVDGPTRVTGVELLLPAGEVREVVFRFRLPGTTGSLTVEPSARLPGISWRHRASSWQDNAPRVAKW